MPSSGKPPCQDDGRTNRLTALYTVQENMGVKPRTTDEAKRKMAENTTTTIRRGEKAQIRGARFLELKSSILSRLQAIQQLQKNMPMEKESSSMTDFNNTKVIIKMQAQVREQMKLVEKEWKEMSDMYKRESQKKKSKFTSEELEIQSEIVYGWQQEIEKVKQGHLRGYNRGRDSSASISLNSNVLYSDSNIISPSDGSHDPSWAGTGTDQVAVTDGQQKQILQIEKRDADFDRHLDDIELGVRDLADIARMQDEEVQRQTVFLDDANNKMDMHNNIMKSNNSELGGIVEKVKRRGNKLCVDIVCSLLTVALIVLLYKIYQQN